MTLKLWKIDNKQTNTNKTHTHTHIKAKIIVIVFWFWFWIEATLNIKLWFDHLTTKPNWNRHLVRKIRIAYNCNWISSSFERAYISHRYQQVGTLYHVTYCIRLFHCITFSQFIVLHVIYSCTNQKNSAMSMNEEDRAGKRVRERMNVIVRKWESCVEIQ